MFGPTLEKLAKIGLTAADVVYVGDHAFDHQASTGAGIDFVGVGTGLVTVVDFHARGAQAVPSVADLKIVV